MKILATLVIGVIAFNAVVLPNAQQALLAAFMVFGAGLSVLYRQYVPVATFRMLFASWSVTVLYIMVGAIRGATTAAAMQTVIIYIVSPLIWLLIIDLSWRLFGVERIVRAFAVLALAASISVAVYMYLFLNFGPQSVRIFGANANVHLEDGYSGVIMHVSGSLIFLGAAFAAEPSATRTRILGVLALFGLALAVVASGRTAAIAGFVIGGVFFLTTLLNRKQLRRNIIWLVALLFVAPVVYFGMEFFLGVSLPQLLERHLTKIQSGDVERPAQISALLKGIEETWFLGAGHGIGVDYLRSTEFPWRYEAVFVALFYKTGFFGALIILFPIIYSLCIFIHSLTFGSIRQYDSFFGAALVACLFAGFTNPYPEAFAFQWMYLVPTYYFIGPRRTISIRHAVGSTLRNPTLETVL